jgi:probable phosphoglycerate mutase
MMLVVVRHGQTDWNAEERYQGQLDIPLNAAGRRQAEALKAQLSGIRFDAAYSSPLRRAFETAQIIANDVPLIPDARLTEIHHGHWQGKTKAEIEKQWPDEWNRWNQEPTRFTPPGGERAERVRSRVEDFLSAIKGTAVLCVSHGVVIQTLLSILDGTEHNAHVPANGSIHTFVL